MPIPTERTATIYALVEASEPNPIRRVRYIGQTVRPLPFRLKIHWQTARRGESTHRAAWMRLAAAESRPIEILALLSVPESAADAAEVSEIAKWLAAGADLTNRTIGGGGVRGRVVTDETRRRLREAAKRRGAVSAETKARQSAAMRGKFPSEFYRALNVGRTRSADTRRKMSAARAGEGNGMARLTWTAVDAIRSRYDAGERQFELAAAFGVSRALINRVVHREGWIR